MKALKKLRNSTPMTTKLALLCLLLGSWIFSGPLTLGAKGPPPPISSLYALAGDRAVKLLWNQVGDSTTAGYHVYRKCVEDSSYTKITESPTAETTYVDLGVNNDTTYFYVVVWVDTGLVEGPLSNEAVVLPNRWILFVENWDIYRMDAVDANQDTLGDRRTQLTTDPGVDITPHLSPDGTRVVFSSNRDGNFELYAMNSIDGGDRIRLTSNTFTDVSPSWSYDGRKIVYSSDEFNNYDIFIMNDDGTEISRATTHPSYDGNPAWAPENNLIAFDTNRDGGDYEIYIVNANNPSSPINITTNPLDDGCPQWASMGMTIIYSSRRQEAEWKPENAPFERFNICKTDTPWIHGVNYTVQSIYDGSHNLYPHILPGQFNFIDSASIYFSSDLGEDAEINLMKVLYPTGQWDTEIISLTLDTLHNSPTGGVRTIQPEIIPPASPGDVTADTNPRKSAIVLSWSPNVEGDFVHYCVYRDTAAGHIATPEKRLDTLSACTYTDTTVEPDMIYYYVITAVDSLGSESGYTCTVSGKVTVDEEVTHDIVPRRLILAQNYPNPFNATTQISFVVPKRCPVRLTVYNLLGQQVATLANQIHDAGPQSVSWDSRNQTGDEVPTGIYLYRISAGEVMETRKMVLIR